MKMSSVRQEPVLHPPALCRSCGKLFPATSISLSDSRNITFQDVSSGPCPSCGGTGDVLNGTYDAMNDVLKLLAGPDSTFDILRKAAAIVQESRAAGESPEQAVERVAAALPQFASFRDRAGLVGKWLAVTVLAALAQKVLVDPFFEKKPEVTKAEIRTIVGDEIEKALMAREAAAKQACIVEPALAPRTAVSSPKAQPPQARFPKSMQKLQQALKQRYAPAKKNSGRNGK